MAAKVVSRIGRPPLKEPRTVNVSCRLTAAEAQSLEALRQRPEQKLSNIVLMMIQKLTP